MLRPLLLLAMLTLWPGAAFPHAALVSSEPADGTTLPDAPRQMVLRFDEAVTLIDLRLVGPAGAHLAPSAAPAAQDGVVRVAYPADLPHGAYLLSYRVLSADGHPVAGTIAFAVGSGGGAVSGQRTLSNIWTVPSEIARWLFYLAVVASAGGALFRALVADIPARLAVWLARVAGVGAVLAVLQVGLRGALIADARPADLLSATPWRIGADTTLLCGLLVSMVGLLGCVATLRSSGRRARMLGALAALVVLAGFPLSGHAASAAPRWLAGPALFAHVLAVALWIGALWPLQALLNNRAVVRRFSAWAAPAVVVLALSGVILATVQLPSPAALMQTTYGILLLGKLSGLAVLVCLAVWNRVWLTPALPRADNLLRRSIAIEATVAAGILGLTAVLTLTQPPRVMAAEVAILTATSGDLTARIEVAPARVGANRFVVTPDTHHPEPREVWLELAPEGAGIAPVRRRLQRDPTGRFMLSDFDMPLSGRWALRLQVLLSDYQQVDLTTTVNVR